MRASLEPTQSKTDSTLEAVEHLAGLEAVGNHAVVYLIGWLAQSLERLYQGQPVLSLCDF